MQNIHKTTLYLLIVLAAYSKDIHCLRMSSQDERIVGGSETNITAYPYQAFLKLYKLNKEKGYSDGGGIIISNTYILTAAHCVFGAYKVEVRIGSTYFDHGGKEYEAKNFTRHPKFNHDTIDYDVGLIKTPEMDLDGTYAKAIKLVKSGYEAEDMAIVLVSGWGFTKENGNLSNTLKVVKLNIVNREICNERYEITITSRMICAGVMEGGKGHCQGDSGGPAVLQSNHRAVGIVSFSRGCGRANYPGGYTNIGNTEIRKYIKDISGV